MNPPKLELSDHEDQGSEIQKPPAVELEHPLPQIDLVSQYELENDKADEEKSDESEIQYNASEGEPKFATGIDVRVPDDEPFITTETVRMVPISPGNRKEQPTWPGKTFDLYRKIAKLHNKFFDVHTQLNFERDSIKPRLRHLNEILATLEQLLRPADSRRITELDHKAFTDVYSQFAAGRKSFEEQIQVVDDHEEQVAQLLFRLAKLEPELVQIMDAYFKKDKHIQDDASEEASLLSRSPSPDLHPLEEQYYDKRGMVRLLREQLINHTANFQASSDAESNIGKYSTEDQYVHSGAFREWWQSEHTRLTEELRVAEKQLAQLWNECRDAQLDVHMLNMQHLTNAETFSKSSSTLESNDSDAAEFTAPFLPRDRHGMVPDFLQDIRWSKQRERVGPFLEELARLTGKRDFIEEWVGKIPLGKTSPRDPVDFEPEISFATSEPDWSYVHRKADEIEYEILPLDGGEAPNGEALEPRPPGTMQRLIRRVLSDGALDTRFWQFSKSSSGVARQDSR